MTDENQMKLVGNLNSCLNSKFNIIEKLTKSLKDERLENLRIREKMNFSEQKMQELGKNYDVMGGGNGGFRQENENMRREIGRMGNVIYMLRSELDGEKGRFDLG